MAGEDNINDQGNVGNPSLSSGFSSPAYGLSGGQGQSLMPASQIGAPSLPILPPSLVGKDWQTMPYGASRFTAYYTQFEANSLGFGPLNLAFSPPPGYTAVIRNITVLTTLFYANSKFVEWFPAIGNNWLSALTPAVNGTALKSIPYIPTFSRGVDTFIPVADVDVFDLLLQSTGNLGADCYAYVKLSGDYLLSRGLPASQEVSI